MKKPEKLLWLSKFTWRGWLNQKNAIRRESMDASGARRRILAYRVVFWKRSPRLVLLRRVVPGQKEKSSKRIDRLLLFCVGRRDWTRTNDPHHVKVVL
jgi:hypothetical protein